MDEQSTVSEQYRQGFKDGILEVLGQILIVAACYALVMLDHC